MPFTALSLCIGIPPLFATINLVHRANILRFGFIHRLKCPLSPIPSRLILPLIIMLMLVKWQLSRLAKLSLLPIVLISGCCSGSTYPFPGMMFISVVFDSYHCKSHPGLCLQSSATFMHQLMLVSHDTLLLVLVHVASLTVSWLGLWSGWFTLRPSEFLLIKKHLATFTLLILLFPCLLSI